MLANVMFPPPNVLFSFRTFYLRLEILFSTMPISSNCIVPFVLVIQKPRKCFILVNAKVMYFKCIS